MGLTTRKPRTTFEEILNGNGNSLRTIPSSDNGEDSKDEDDDEEDTKLGQVSQNDELYWVLGTVFRNVQHCMKKFRQS